MAAKGVGIGKCGRALAALKRFLAWNESDRKKCSMVGKKVFGYLDLLQNVGIM